MNKLPYNTNIFYCFVVNNQPLSNDKSLRGGYRFDKENFIGTEYATRTGFPFAYRESHRVRSCR